MHFEVEGPEGGRLKLGDGGFTDWTRRLTGNRMERLRVTGFGSELATRLFAPA